MISEEDVAPYVRMTKWQDGRWHVELMRWSAIADAYMVTMLTVLPKGIKDTDAKAYAKKFADKEGVALR